MRSRPARAIASALVWGAALMTVSGAATGQTPAAAATSPSAAWLAYGRTPDADNASILSPTDAGVKSLKPAWSVSVGSSVTAQPLYVPSVIVNGKDRELLIVATGANVVYALDPETGKTIWKQSLGPTLPQVCGGTGGIQSTPAIDAANDLVYVIGADGRLRALSLQTGKPVAGWSVQIIKRVDVETVWGALRISGNSIYVPVASWCDKPDAAGAWDGRLVAVDRTARRITAEFDVVPGADNGGGIWGPGGVSIDPRDGSIWTATANAVVYANGNLDENAPLAERVVHLTTKLKPLASVVEPDDNPSVAGDQGFGATPMLFQPAGCAPLLAVNSKDSYTYVWQRDNLAAAPLVRMQLGASGADNTFYAQPTWVAATRTLVVGGAQLPNGGFGAVGFHVSANCTFSLAWTANVGGGIQPQPLAVGTFAFVSVTENNELVALDSATGKVVKTLPTGSAAYAAPMTAGDHVVVGTVNGTVLAFGGAQRAQTTAKG